MEYCIMEELARKFEAVSLTNMSCRGPKGKDPYRCVWCDSVDHARKDCASLQAAIQQNLIYMEDNIIHWSETWKPLQVNFGRGVYRKSWMRPMWAKSKLYTMPHPSVQESGRGNSEWLIGKGSFRVKVCQSEDPKIEEDGRQRYQHKDGKQGVQWRDGKFHNDNDKSDVA